MGQFSIGFGNRQTMGYTAQEVQEIVDKAIKDNFNNYMGVSGSLSLLLSEVVKTECAKTIEQALKDGKNEFSQELRALKESINFDNIKHRLAATRRNDDQLNYEIDKLYGEYCNLSAELLSKCNSICDMLNSINSSCEGLTMGQQEIKDLVSQYLKLSESNNEKAIQTIKQQANFLADKIAEEGKRTREKQDKYYKEAIGYYKKNIERFEDLEEGFKYLKEVINSMQQQNFVIGQDKNDCAQLEKKLDRLERKVDDYNIQLTKLCKIEVKDKNTAEKLVQNAKKTLTAQMKDALKLQIEMYCNCLRTGTQNIGTKKQEEFQGTQEIKRKITEICSRYGVETVNEEYMIRLERELLSVLKDKRGVPIASINVAIKKINRYKNEMNGLISELKYIVNDSSKINDWNTRYMEVVLKYCSCLREEAQQIRIKKKSVFVDARSYRRELVSLCESAGIQLVDFDKVEDDLLKRLQIFGAENFAVLDETNKKVADLQRELENKLPIAA